MEKALEKSVELTPEVLAHVASLGDRYINYLYFKELYPVVIMFIMFFVGWKVFVKLNSTEKS